MLPVLKERHPSLKVITTVFNDRAPYLQQSIDTQNYIDAFTTDNNAVGRIFTRELGEDRMIDVIPNGINIDAEFNPEKFDREKVRKRLGLKSNDMAIFFIGRLSEEKNPDVFVQAAAHCIATAGGRAKFFVIGDGPMKADIDKAIYDIGSKQIVYLGYQSKIAEYLAAADVFVLPSAVEGFPLSILEAMAMGVAVIASDVGAVSDVIENGKTGFVVEAGSEIEVGEILEKLLADPSLLAKVKQKGRSEVTRMYSNRILRDNYNKLYKEVLT